MRQPTSVIQSRFVEALGRSVLSYGPLTTKPLEVEVGSPLNASLRLYIYNLTHPPGGRTTGEHKIQLIAPGQPKGTRGNFDFQGGHFVILAGYQAELDVFSLWDAGLYRDFTHSRNVQVKAETLYKAYSIGLATQDRNVWSQKHQREDGWNGIETVVAATSSHLLRAIRERMSYTLRRLLNT